MFKNLFSKSSPIDPIIPDEHFSIFKINLENGWGLASINKAYDDYPNKRHFPWYAIVNIDVEDRNENGHPTDKEAELLNRIEQSISEFLNKGRIVHFIGRVITPGQRDLLYYTDNRKFDPQETRTFFDSINALRPINFEIHKDPEWKLVRSFIS